MTDREKALEAAQAIGDLGDDLSYLADARKLGLPEKAYQLSKQVAALAMPATVDGADFLRGWEAGRDAAADEAARHGWPATMSNEEYNGLTEAKEERFSTATFIEGRIRNLTPPEDSP